MFAPGGNARYQAVQDAELTKQMRRATWMGDDAREFSCALALILPALRAHLEQQSEICRVIG